MNVLSLFDGMCCGMIAFINAGIIPDEYYAFEIDKYAIRTSLLIEATRRNNNEK